jgi:signal transduction histidine kinase
MKIRAKERLVTIVVLAIIGLIAALVWWTYEEVDVANRERQQASEIARGLSQSRLLTFEYRLYHTERAKLQWLAVSNRLDRLIADTHSSIPTQDRILAAIRARRVTILQLFTELTSAEAGSRADAALDELTRLFEGTLFSRLLADEQENFADIFRLTDIATARINDAQRRLLIEILTGLVLIALAKGFASWLINHDALGPLARLQQAAKEIGAGNWNFKPDVGRDDEIGELSNNFNGMTKSLRESFARIERNNHDLAALNEELKAFSYSVSHDLRAPLRSMDGFSLALLEDYGDKLDEEGKDALRRIRAASQRMGDLIDDLLRLSEVTRAELCVTRVDLSALARAIADGIDREQSGRSVEWAIESGLSIRADLGLLRIAMQNLLRNAWKFTGRTEKPVIRVGALERDAKTVYFVADNGVGFDMAHAHNLFGAFQRLHHAEDFPGTGIGLAIVQRIIRRHDGKIWAEAKEGEGATFFFTVKESENGSEGQANPAG